MVYLWVADGMPVGSADGYIPVGSGWYACGYACFSIPSYDLTRGKHAGHSWFLFFLFRGMLMVTFWVARL